MGTTHTESQQNKSQENEVRQESRAKRAQSHYDASNDAGHSHRSTRQSKDETNERPRSSIGSMISQSLAEESQQGVDRVLAEVRDGIETAREYIAENPREAIALAAAAGVVAWALLGTKPGRKAFEAGAALAVPYATKWVARNMADALR